MSLNFCPKCGSKLAPDAEFCNSCGADISKKRKEKELEKKEKEKKESKHEKSKKKIKAEYAGPLIRLIAFIIDIIIIAIINGIIWSGVEIIDWSSDPPKLLVPRYIWFLNNLSFWLIGLLYFFIFEVYNDGQTLGKMIFKIQTVNEKTLKKAEKSDYLINNLSKASIFLILDIIVGVLKNYGEKEKRLRYTQNLSKTVVIKKK
ncbi:MAG: RDD family protein [Promethearchaeota archaeon]